MLTAQRLSRCLMVGATGPWGMVVTVLPSGMVQATVASLLIVAVTMPSVLRLWQRRHRHWRLAGVNPCGGEPGTAATVSGRKSAGGKCDLRR